MLTGPGAYSATPIRDASPGVSAITGSAAAAAAGVHGHISVGSLRGGVGSPHLLICQLARCLHPVLHPRHHQTVADTEGAAAAAAPGAGCPGELRPLFRRNSHLRNPSPPQKRKGCAGPIVPAPPGRAGVEAEPDSLPLRIPSCMFHVRPWLSPQMRDAGRAAPTHVRSRRRRRAPPLWRSDRFSRVVLLLASARGASAAV